MKELKEVLVRLWWFAKSWKYPYIYNLKLEEKESYFFINSPIEEFRIKDWGGEKHFVRYLINILKKNEVFFDIGASVGFISVLAALKLENGTVFSFEPDRKIVNRLKKNIKLNKLKNLKVFPIALGEGKGIVRLYTEGSDANSPSIRPVQGFKKFVRVSINTVDELIIKGHVTAPTSVKIDVEGAEMLVLRGMSRLLSSKKKPKNIFIEVHQDFLRQFDSDKDEVLAFLREREYKPLLKIERSN